MRGEGYRTTSADQGKRGAVRGMSFYHPRPLHRRDGSGAGVVIDDNNASWRGKGRGLPQIREITTLLLWVLYIPSPVSRQHQEVGGNIGSARTLLQ